MENTQFADFRHVNVGSLFFVLDDLKIEHSSNLSHFWIAQISRKFENSAHFRCFLHAKSHTALATRGFAFRGVVSKGRHYLLPSRFYVSQIIPQIFSMPRLSTACVQLQTRLKAIWTSVAEARGNLDLLLHRAKKTIYLR